MITSEIEIDFDSIDDEVSDCDTNNRYHCVGRFEKTDIWAAYTVEQTGPSESSYTIEGIGHFSPCDLDREVMIETYRDVLNNPPDIYEQKNSDTSEFDTSDDHIETVVDTLIKVWKFMVEERIDEWLQNGQVGIYETKLMGKHPEGLHPVANDTYREVFGRNNISAIEKEAISDALDTAISEHQISWHNPTAEYFAYLTFDIEEWELRALELRHNSVLANKPVTARVAALLDAGYAKSEIADKLDVSRPAVSQRVSDIEKWTERAEWTVEDEYDPDDYRLT